MRKLFLTLFFLFSLAFGTIAAVPILTKVVGPEMMLDVEPPSGVPVGYREFPIPERSVVAVKLQLPLSVLSDLATKNTPRSLSGVEYKNVHPKIREGRVQWKMYPGKLELRNNGKGLYYKLPVRGTAFATGKYGALRIGIKGDSNMGGSISGVMSPTINSHWQINPDINPILRVDYANAKIGILGTRDVRAEVQKAVSPLVKKELDKASPGLEKALDIKTRVQKLWNEGHLSKQISSEPNTWMVFDPGLAQMGPINYSDPDQISLTMGMVAQTFITNTEAELRAPEPLPQLQLTRENPTTDIRIPLIANLRVLNHTLSKETFDVKTQFGPTVKVTEPRVEMGKQGFLNLSLNLSALSGSWGGGIKGKIWVQGRPIVDYEKQTFGFKDVTLTVETREALSGATAWLLEEVIVKSVENSLRADFSEYLPKLETEIHKIVTGGLIPDHIKMSIDKPKVSLLGVYTVERTSWNEGYSPGIVVVLGAKAKIGVQLENFSF